MKKILVIGGGFFGMYLSEYLSRQGHEVILSEKEEDFMQRASYVNQARVHNGYHYPRSILTALRSRISFPRFYEEFNACIDDTFDKYYMISQLPSKISASQFKKFCYRIGAVCEPAPAKITDLVDSNYVEAVFTTKEFAFDSCKLKQLMLERIEDAGVQYHLKQKVLSVSPVNNKLLVSISSVTDERELESIEVDDVFNCTYSMINQIITDSSLEMIPLKHELTEMALVEVPDELKHAGITVMDGPFSDPHFKPDFAPDMFLSQNYMSHLGVIKKELIDKVDGFTVGLEGAQDYDLYLKVLEHTTKINHIQKVLYHWRKIPGSTAADFDDKSYAQEAGVKALENAMKRRKLDATVSNGKYPGTYKVSYNISNNPLVSIIIPFKDKPELLTMCIESILDKTTYANFEVIGISNNSEEKNTFDEMQRLESLDNRIKFYEYNVPFNYSDINNHAVNTYANGEHILLLNNDIKIISENWIEEMLMHSQRDEVGVVGAKLYYPNDTIQHAGVIIRIGGIAGHSHKYLQKDDAGYFSRLNLIQNLSAVTAACFMVKKRIFNELDGLNKKELKVAFNDVDFCLRVYKTPTI